MTDHFLVRRRRHRFSALLLNHAPTFIMSSRVAAYGWTRARLGFQLRQIDDAFSLSRQFPRPSLVFDGEKAAAFTFLALLYTYVCVCIHFSPFRPSPSFGYEGDLRAVQSFTLLGVDRNEQLGDP